MRSLIFSVLSLLLASVAAFGTDHATSSPTQEKTARAEQPALSADQIAALVDKLPGNYVGKSADETRDCSVSVKESGFLQHNLVVTISDPKNPDPHAQVTSFTISKFTLRGSYNSFSKEFNYERYLGLPGLFTAPANEILQISYLQEGKEDSDLSLLGTEITQNGAQQLFSQPNQISATCWNLKRAATPAALNDNNTVGVELWHCSGDKRSVDIKVAVPGVGLAAFDSTQPQSPIGLTIPTESESELSLIYADSSSQGKAFHLRILRGEPVGVEKATGKNLYAAQLMSHGSSAMLQCTSSRE